MLLDERVYYKTKVLSYVTECIMPFVVIFTANTALPRSSLSVTGDSLLYLSHAHVLY